MSPSAVEVNGHIPNAKNSELKATAPSFSPASVTASKYHCTSSEEAIQKEHTYGAHNYHPLPIVFARAQGANVWDPEGKQYLDFLSAYSAVNQGHCHPKLVKALCDQASTLTLSSRAFYNDVFPRFAEFVTKYFGFDMVLPMNTGAEAVETAIKIARKWGYKVKGIPQNEAIVISVAENFHGRTFSAISMSTDPESRENYGPYLPGVGSVCPVTGQPIPFNDVSAVKTAFESHGNKIAAFLVEPIQGEAGIVVPDDNYLSEIRKLCDKHNILLICDEIQTGIARTGKLLCHEWSGIKPDMVLLGKAISGGMYPVSCVLARKDIMLTVEPGTHGSTYGGNPLGCAVAIRALEVIEEENMVANAQALGEHFRSGLRALNNPMIKLVRGKGLLNAIVIDETKTNGHSAWDLCMLLKEKGLLVGRALKIAHVGSSTKTPSSPPCPRSSDGKQPQKSSDSTSTPTTTAVIEEPPTDISFPIKAKPTHENIIRLAPPLVITEAEVNRALDIIAEAMRELPGLKGEQQDKVIPPSEQNVHIHIEN